MWDSPEGLRREILENQTLDALTQRILEDRQAEEARALLKRISAQHDGRDIASEEVYALYNGMLASLNEADFRWTATPWVNRKQLRRQRLAEYQRFRELFELEVMIAQKVNRSQMALTSDWSEVGAYLRDVAITAKAKWMLRLAGFWFKFSIPGARDLCDAAAFSLFSASYLAA